MCTARSLLPRLKFRGPPQLGAASSAPIIQYVTSWGWVRSWHGLACIDLGSNGATGLNFGHGDNLGGARSAGSAPCGRVSPVIAGVAASATCGELALVITATAKEASGAKESE
eukprot:2939951-Amphidinium_carterae.2